MIHEEIAEAAISKDSTAEFSYDTACFQPGFRYRIKISESLQRRYCSSGKGSMPIAAFISMTQPRNQPDALPGGPAPGSSHCENCGDTVGEFAIGYSGMRGACLRQLCTLKRAKLVCRTAVRIRDAARSKSAIYRHTGVSTQGRFERSASKSSSRPLAAQKSASGPRTPFGDLNVTGHLSGLRYQYGRVLDPGPDRAIPSVRWTLQELSDFPLPYASGRNSPIWVRK